VGIRIINILLMLRRFWQKKDTLFENLSGYEYITPREKSRTRVTARR